MIERRGIDKLAILKEELSINQLGETIEISREEMKELDSDVIANEKNDDWAGDICSFFKELVKHDAVEGLALSSQPDGEVHVDYFCKGKDGSEIGNVIASIELARYFVGNPVGSIRWIGQTQSLNDTFKQFKSQLIHERHQRELLLITKFV